MHVLRPPGRWDSARRFNSQSRNVKLRPNIASGLGRRGSRQLHKARNDRLGVRAPRRWATEPQPAVEGPRTCRSVPNPAAGSVSFFGAERSVGRYPEFRSPTSGRLLRLWGPGFCASSSRRRAARTGSARHGLRSRIRRHRWGNSVARTTRLEVLECEGEGVFAAHGGAFGTGLLVAGISQHFPGFVPRLVVRTARPGPRLATRATAVAPSGFEGAGEDAAARASPK